MDCNSCMNFLVRLLVLDGSSHWFFEQNIICMANIYELDGTKPTVRTHYSSILHLTLARQDII